MGGEDGIIGRGGWIGPKGAVFLISRGLHSSQIPPDKDGKSDAIHNEIVQDILSDLLMEVVYYQVYSLRYCI